MSAVKSKRQNLKTEGKTSYDFIHQGRYLQKNMQLARAIGHSENII
jgi:hypothetical protein